MLKVTGYSIRSYVRSKFCQRPQETCEQFEVNIVIVTDPLYTDDIFRCHISHTEGASKHCKWVS